MLLVKPYPSAGCLHLSAWHAKSLPAELKTPSEDLYERGNRFRLNFICALAIVTVALFANASSCLAQTSSGSTPSALSTPQSAAPPVQNPTAVAPLGLLAGAAGLGDGPILAGDTVEVQVFDDPELSVRAQVSQSGDIPVPLVGVFHIAGLTSTEAAAALTNEFKNRDFLQHPNILVTVQQSGNGVTVAGEVRVPGIYPVNGKHRLIDVLTRAGGPNDNAAHVIEVTGPGADQLQRVVWDPTFQENPATRVYLEAGQTVLVGKCGVVYLGGNLAKPGAFPLCGSRHTTVSEAVALAGGVRPSSSASRTVLLRTELGTRTVRTVDIESILRGKSPDFTLNSDDILYVPGSVLKASAKSLAQTALNLASVYGAFKLQQP